METRCEACGARMHGDAEWCSLCLTRAPSQTPAFHTRPAPAAPVPAPAAAPALAPAPARQAVTVPAARGPQWEAPTWTASPFSPPVAAAPARPLAPAPNQMWPPATPVPAASTPAPADTSPVRTVDAGVFRTALGVIFLGVVVQIVLLIVARMSNWEPAVAIRYGLWTDILFYAVVAERVVRRAREVAFRPIWTEGDPTEALLHGAFIGGGLALALVVFDRLVTGQVTGDPRIGIIMSERTLPRVVGAILIACVAAPWVEELLFRGLALESLRPWGTPAAIFGSACLFSLWHTDVVLAGWRLHLVPFLYYVGMGSTFGKLYLKRGMKASIAAHTAFNGMLIVVSLTLMTGPSHMVSGAGVTARVPATWQAVDRTKNPGLNSFDLAVNGPSGSGLLVTHHPMPAGTHLTTDMLAVIEPEGMARMGVQVEPGSTRTAELPMGHVARLTANAKGHNAQVVLLAKDDTVWVTVLVAGGSHRAEKDFEGILTHLQVP